MKNRVIGTLMCLLLTISLAGCGDRDTTATNVQENLGISTDSVSNNNSWGFTNKESDETYTDWENQDNITELSDVADVSNKQVINEEKLVYKAEIDIETKDFDSSITMLKSKISDLNGIIQSQSYYDDEPYERYEYNSNNYKISGYKRFNTTIRIPTKLFDEFTGSMNDIGHVKSSNSQIENITQQYYNNTAYLESYQNQLQVLQGMYEQTNSISEMLEIESRISEVQAEITKLTTKIQSMDMDVDYSTIIISISEVVEYSDTSKQHEELSFGQKVTERFKTSFRNFVRFLEIMVYILIDVIWFLIGIGIIIVVVVIYAKKRRQKLIKAGRITPDGKPIMPDQNSINNIQNKK